MEREIKKYRGSAAVLRRFFGGNRNIKENKVAREIVSMI